MRKLDFYEFAGIVVPGGVLLAGLIWTHSFGSAVPPFGVSLGGFGVGLVLAYAAGHLVQAVGNLAEWAWWGLWGGMPTDWPRSGKHRLLSPERTRALEKRVRAAFQQPELRLERSLSSGLWVDLVRQIYAAVESRGRAGRVDIFNANYGLCRGLGAALALVAVAAPVLGRTDWRPILAFAAAAGVALWRMHRFAKHYARELFVQFLALPEEPCNGENP